MSRPNNLFLIFFDKFSFKVLTLEKLNDIISLYLSKYLSKSHLRRVK